MTRTQLMNKYGFETTWKNSQAAGTCLSSSHATEVVSAIKSGIMSGRKRVPVFGPVYMILAGELKTTAPNLRTKGAIAKKAGIGRYLGDRWSGPFNDVWEVALVNALFKVTIYEWNTPIQAEYDGLSFPSLETFVEFANEFLNEDGLAYSCSIALSCYFLEDQGIPKIGNVLQKNAFMGALCDAGGGIVDPTALRNPMEPTLLEDWLYALFFEHTGINLPAMPIEDLITLFWVARPSNKKSQYNANLTARAPFDIAGRNMWDSGTSSLVPALQDNHGHVGNELHYWYLNWADKSINHVNGPVRSKLWPTSPTGAVESMVASAHVLDVPTHTYHAVHIAACGCDNLVVGWENGADYLLQFVEETAIGETSAFRRHTLSATPERGQSATNTRRFYKRDWMTHCLSHTCRTQGKGYGDTRARLQRIGTPFVGSLSDWAIKDMAGIPGMRFVGCVVE